MSPGMTQRSFITMIDNEIFLLFEIKIVRYQRSMIFCTKRTIGTLVQTYQ